MQETERQELTERSTALRVELKLWEKDFAAANGGNKASREDIKKHPDIAAKYKEYNKVRDALSGKAVSSKEEPKRQTPLKRKHEGGHVASKRQHITQTPTRGDIKPWDVDPYDSPSVVRNLFTPLKKTALGPTPQKDGHVLGLFDLLQDSPSKTETIQLTGTHVPALLTPRKSTQESTVRHSRTPASTGKRFMLDSFATPLKSRHPNDHGNKTPSSVSKLHFSTPSFLRRDSHRMQLPVLKENEDGTPMSPEMIRVPRKPPVRGLSSILAGLRKMEDEAADDDMEALREMENEMAGLPSKPTQKQQAAPPKEPVLVEDSQPRLPLGGFDDEAMYDTEPEEPKDRGGEPLKVYKKKGQKRTTRRVNMKPTRSKPQGQPQAAIPATEDSDDELATDHDDDAVPETQVDDEFTAGFADVRNFDSDTQSEYTASEGGTRYRRPDQSKKRKVMGKDGKIKTAARKVTAMAHQNFKRLKLRNSGAKGGPAHNSRFRRRK